MEFQITCGSSFKGLLGFEQFAVHGYYNHSSSSSSNSTLILDCERGGEFEKSAANEAVVGKKRVSQTKSLQALKSHSDAERRRRVRINAHFTTLRGLLPSSSSDDKVPFSNPLIFLYKFITSSFKKIHSKIFRNPNWTF